MKLVDVVLSKEEINGLREEYGDYVKVTVDIDKGWLVAGCELHADGEKVLLDKDSKQSDIWGGWVNFEDKEIELTAVLNIRPSLGNPGMEIIDEMRRSKFIKVVKNMFRELWN